jgi:hypothetical protein
VDTHGSESNRKAVEALGLERISNDALKDETELAACPVSPFRAFFFLVQTQRQSLHPLHVCIEKMVIKRK